MHDGHLFAISQIDSLLRFSSSFLCGLDKTNTHTHHRIWTGLFGM